MFYINFIEYIHDKFINYGFTTLDNTIIQPNILEILTKHIYNMSIKNDIFKNNNICILNFDKNRQLSITKCFQDDISISLDKIQTKINNIIKNTKSKNEYNIITFKINLHCIEDIIDNNFSIKVNKYKCNSKYIKNFINIY